MKQTELRIGNLVSHDGITREVTEIGTKEMREGICGYVRFKNIGTWLEHNQKNLVHPIPLTEKWLLRFGFKEFPIQSETHPWSDWELDDFVISMPYFSFVWGDTETEIKYVHQLQNLYHALTGQELKIKE